MRSSAHVAAPTRSLRRDIIVIGASAGGLSALLELARGLPEGFPAALFVVVHTSPDNPGVLPQILRRAGPLPAVLASDNQAITTGRIYVAPPDHHLTLKPGHVRVTRGPRENGFRPAVDPLFRTAARAYGRRVIGVVLSGGLNDGTHGLARIVAHGGLGIAQDPQDALIPSMPLSAIQNVEVARVLKAVDLAPALTELVHATIETLEEHAETMPAETPDIAETGDSLRVHAPPGTPAPYTCPECGGALWEVEEGRNLLRFRCHVGHAFTAEALLSEQDANFDNALWRALRALEENADLSRRMAERADRAGLADLARRYTTSSDEVEASARIIRNVLQREGLSRSPQPADPDPKTPR